MIRHDIVRWWVRYDKINDPTAKYQYYNQNLGTLCAETKDGETIQLARCVKESDNGGYTVTDIASGKVLRQTGKYTTPNFNYGSIMSKVYQSNLLGLIRFYMSPNQHLNHVIAVSKSLSQL